MKILIPALLSAVLFLTYSTQLLAAEGGKNQQKPGQQAQTGKTEQTTQTSGPQSLVNTGNPNTSILTSEYANGLPIVNDFTEEGGCYIACYANAPGVYSVDNYGVHGMIRVKGSYPVTAFSNEEANRICHPETEAGADADIAGLEVLKNLCNKSFTTCQNGCWAGGDTGGFFLRM